VLGEHGCIVLQAGRRAALAVAAARGLWLRCHLATSYAQMRGAGWRVAIDTSSRCLRSAVGADGPWSCREWRSQERLSRLLQTSKKMGARARPRRWARARRKTRRELTCSVAASPLLLHTHTTHKGTSARQFSSPPSSDEYNFYSMYYPNGACVGMRSDIF